MLDADAHGKGFRLHGDAVLIQHLIRVPGRMPDSQEDRVCRYPFAPCETNARYVPRFRLYGFHPRPETDFAAQPQDLGAYIFYDFPQPVGADMRLRQIADLLRRARAHKSVQHIPLQRVAAPGRQFTVGKRTRTALAELHVRILIQRTSRPKPCNRRVTRVHVLPALEDEGRAARRRKRQRREHTGGTESHDDGSPDWREALFFREARENRRRFFRRGGDFFIPSKPRQQTSFIFLRFHIQHAGKANGRPAPPPRVHRPPHEFRAAHRFAANRETLRRNLFPGPHIGNGHRQPFDPYHTSSINKKADAGAKENSILRAPSGKPFNSSSLQCARSPSCS